MTQIMQHEEENSKKINKVVNFNQKLSRYLYHFRTLTNPTKNYYSFV